MTNENMIELLTMDGCTNAEAEKHIKNGTIVFEDFEERFISYMNEWGINNEERKEYKKMIETKKPMADWGIVENAGKIFYIMYTL